MTISYLISSFAALFALINPLSALPVFISLTENHDAKWRNYQIRKTCMYIILICACAYFVGSHILGFFGISINALKIAGGMIISRSGFLLLNAKHKADVKGKTKKEAMEKERFELACMEELLKISTIGVLSAKSIIELEDSLINSI